MRKLIQNEAQSESSDHAIISETEGISNILKEYPIFCYINIF